MIRGLLASVFLVFSASAPAFADDAAVRGAFVSSRQPFEVTLNQGVSVDLAVFSLSALPGETVRLDAPAGTLLQSDLAFAESEPGVFTLTAPAAPGLHVVELSHGGAVMRLNLFVARPASEIENGALEGYLIGDYPREPFRGLEVYKAPAGFIEITPDNIDLPVSPHFTLGQFLCKQEADWPRYAVIRPELLLKLERLLEAANHHGWRTDGFVVMSGYRTPAYNAAIGNGRHSRHVYGGAADIFIDEDRDGVMDDLNGDGRIDKRDAAALFDFVEAWTVSEEGKPLEGGIGEYDANAYHGPFVHVDARGYAARWGR